MIEAPDAGIQQDRFGLAGARALNAVDRHAMVVVGVIEVLLQLVERNVDGAGYIFDPEFVRFTQVDHEGRSSGLRQCLDPLRGGPAT